MDHLTAYLKVRPLPKELTQRVKAYYRTFYMARTGFSEHSMLDDLPTSLRQEVGMHLITSAMNKCAVLSHTHTHPPFHTCTQPRALH